MPYIHQWLFKKTSSIPSPVASTKSTESDISHSYDALYNRYPSAAYSADEWYATGSLDYPFDISNVKGMGNDEEFMAKFYMTEDILKKATTTELLDLIKKWPFIFYEAYNNPAECYEYILDYFNAAVYIENRTDLAEILLEEYTACSLSDDSYWNEDIAYMEMLLAKDFILKQKDRSISASVFCGTICASKDSSWYDYITSNYASDSDICILLADAADRFHY